MTLRFTILTHDYPHRHWDLLLEQESEEKLATWRLERPPEPGLIISAERLADHRRIYLDYEGPVSGDRGEVHQWDTGEFTKRAESEDALEIEIVGGRIQGEIVIRKNDAGLWGLEYRESV